MQALVKDIAQAGGIITEQDLRNAQPTIKPAIASKVWGLDIISAPPPSSGAVLIAALHILQGATLYCTESQTCATFNFQGNTASLISYY